MTIFVLTYDLNKEPTSAGYTRLINELTRLGSHRFQASAWLASLNNTAAEVHTHFKKMLDADDLLWVSELTHEHYYTARSGTTEWLKKNPPKR